MNARPEADFKYFSKLNAVYLSENAKYDSNFTGSLDLVAGTKPFLCLKNRSFRFSVQPRYVFLSAHMRMYT